MITLSTWLPARYADGSIQVECIFSALSPIYCFNLFHSGLLLIDFVQSGTYAFITNHLEVAEVMPSLSDLRKALHHLIYPVTHDEQFRPG